MKLISYILFFFSAILLLYGCSCSTAMKQSEDMSLKLTDMKIEVQIPEAIIRKADEIIKKRTGDNFFKNFINLNLEKSREIPDSYFISYSFKMPGKDYINEEITLILDKQGNLQPGYDIAGIPDCTIDSCNYEITKEKALSIAEESGMKPGIKDWELSFEWDSSQARYVWMVRSTLSESMGSNGKRGTGERMLIDANSGEVLLKTEWKVF